MFPNWHPRPVASLRTSSLRVAVVTAAILLGMAYLAGFQYDPEAFGIPAAKAAEGTFSFTELKGDQTGLKAIMEAWRADETARQGGKVSDWWPWGITVFDYDNDGDQDLLVCQHSKVGCSILRNNLVESGSLTFTDVSQSLVGDKRLLPLSAGKPKVFDFDKDGWLDILGLFNQRSFFNNKGESFTAIPNFALAINYPRWLKTDSSNLSGVTDLNGDGYLDVTNIYRDYLYLPSKRTFARQEKPSYAPPMLPADVQALIGKNANSPEMRVDYFDYDLNNDGRDDLIVSGYMAYGPLKFMRVLTRQPGGELGDRTSEVGFDGSSYVILIEDFNQDNRLDMLVGRGDSPGLYLANPDFTYTRVRNPNIENTVGMANISYPDSAWAIDFDQDGDQDLVISGRYSALLEVYENDGHGGMARVANPKPWGGGAEPVDFGDMNGDGFVDFVLGTCTDCYLSRVDDIMIYLNNPNAAP